MWVDVAACKTWRGLCCECARCVCARICICVHTPLSVHAAAPLCIRVLSLFVNARC